MAHPEWIDQSLSQDLPVMRARGEGQYLEFIEEFPEKANELGREIAAFASTNPGTILLGVRDDTSLAGLQNVGTPEQRDNLLRRVEGVCNAIQPTITPVVKFAQENGLIVLAIEIPRGSQPLYYSHKRSYVRHLTQSRPAEPHEVIDKVSAWLNDNPQHELYESEKGDFIASVTSELIDILIYSAEVDDRKINPWFELLRVQLSHNGERIRELAHQQIAEDLGFHADLQAIANGLEYVRTYIPTIGSDGWTKLKMHIIAASTRAQNLKKEKIDTLPIKKESQDRVEADLKKLNRELVDLAARSEDLAGQGGMERLQIGASNIGHALFSLSYYLHRLPERDMLTIRSIGRQLHLIETKRIQMDGGFSIRMIVSEVKSLSDQLNRELAGFLSQ